MAYDLITTSYLEKILEWHHKKLWYWNLPTKIKCFIWLCAENQISTWDNLLKKGWSRPNRCRLCKSGHESINHTFVSCHYAFVVCIHLEHMFGLFFSWEDLSLVDNMNWCLQKDREAPHLPIFYIWNLWLAHNHSIFED